MATRGELAVENKKTGINCAQAVAVTFADYTDLDKDVILSMTQAMGAGIGGTMDGTCGALTGAAMIIGLVEKEGKAAATKKAGALMREFKEQNKSVTCKELKGMETGIVLRSCNDCVKDAADMLEKYLETK